MRAERREEGERGMGSGDVGSGSSDQALWRLSAHRRGVTRREAGVVLSVSLYRHIMSAARPSTPPRHQMSTLMSVWIK